MNDVPKDRSTYVQAGIIVLIIVSIGFSGYMINQALEIQTKTDQKIDSFVDRWDKRIKVSNSVNNGTRDVIKDSIQDLVQNLTAHRNVTNQTFTEVKAIENNTAELIKQFNNTNEQERGEAVANITNAIDKNNIILKAIANATNATIEEPQQNNTDIQRLLDILNKG